MQIRAQKYVRCFCTDHSSFSMKCVGHVLCKLKKNHKNARWSWCPDVININCTHLKVLLDISFFTFPGISVAEVIIDDKWHVLNLKKRLRQILLLLLFCSWLHFHTFSFTSSAVLLDTRRSGIGCSAGSWRCFCLRFLFTPAGRCWNYTNRRNFTHRSY